MKSKKKIMLVLSVLMMTLSLSLSNISVLAAENYVITEINDPVTSDFTSGALLTIKANGEYVFDVNDDTAYAYYDTENGVLYYTMRVPVPLSKYNNGLPFVLDNRTTSLLWDLVGTIWLKYDNTVTGETTSNYCNVTMWIQEANMLVYNQSYPLRIEKNVSCPAPNSSAVSNVNSWIYVDDVPEYKRFSGTYVDLEVKLGIQWSYQTFYEQQYLIKPHIAFDMNYLKFYECFGEELLVLNAILDSLKYSETLDEARQRRLLDMYNLLDDMYAEQVENRKAIKALQDEIVALLKEQGSDSNVTDDFASNSDSQSDKLNGLNEQNKMDKIDVDSASSSVDANIDGNAISNYGVVLSSITGQGKVVQLMLIVLSVGLVSYVLFGKR